MDQTQVKETRFIAESFTPTSSDWHPFKLINERLGIAYTIHRPMSCTGIVREVLKDNTPSSNLSKLIKGKCKCINGWRCEHL